MKALSKPFHIAGVKFSDIGKLLSVPPNAVATVTHIPENEFDPFALEVRIVGVRVGFIPRNEQAAWFYHVGHNVKVICRVVEYDTNKPPYEQLKVVFECADHFITTVIKQGTLQS
jgi:hypothetical protein